MTRAGEYPRNPVRDLTAGAPGALSPLKAPKLEVMVLIGREIVPLMPVVHPLLLAQSILLLLVLVSITNLAELELLTVLELVLIV